MNELSAAVVRNIYYLAKSIMIITIVMITLAELFVGLCLLYCHSINSRIELICSLCEYCIQNRLVITRAH